jgi:chromosome segregation ATPase
LLVTAFITILINGTITVPLSSFIMKRKGTSTYGQCFLDSALVAVNMLAQTLRESAVSSGEKPNSENSEQNRQMAIKPMTYYLKFLLAASSSLILPLCATGAEFQAADLNDDKLTSAESQLDKQETDAANKFVKRQAQIINTVPGVNLAPDELKEKPEKQGFSLNPIKWIFAPVIKLQEQSVRLQQQILKLTGPIAALQPAMLNLQTRVENVGKEMGAVFREMHDVHGQLSGVSDRIEQTNVQMKDIAGKLQTTDKHMQRIDSNMDTISAQMSSIQSSLRGTYSVLKTMSPALTDVRSDIHKIQPPLQALQEPLKSVVKPMKTLNEHVSNIDEHLKEVRDPLTNIEKPMISLNNELTGLHSEISQLRMLLGIVLTAIFIAAIFIAVGTPIAAILVWRNKRLILPKPKPGEDSEDDLLSASGKPGSRTR